MIPGSPSMGHFKKLIVHSFMDACLSRAKMCQAGALVPL